MTMSRETGPWLYCLTHQLPEDQATPLGLFCPACKERLYADPPHGRLGAFWESQPGAHASAYTPNASAPVACGTVTDAPGNEAKPSVSQINVASG